jgi:hypothetical protein
VIAAALVFVADASSGPIARSGDDTLRLTVRASKQAGAHALHGARLQLILERPTISGAPSQLLLKSFLIAGPRGLRLHSGAFPTCRVSDFLRSAQLGCPARTRIGKGTATVDYRPAAAGLRQLPVTVFNAKIDIDPATGRPLKRPLPGVVMAAGGQGFALIRLPHADSMLLEQPPSSLDPHLGHPRNVRVNVTIDVSPHHGTPYVQLPSSCPAGGSWRFRVTEENFNGPTLKTRDDLSCRRL